MAGRLSSKKHHTRACVPPNTTRGRAEQANKRIFPSLPPYPPFLSYYGIGRLQASSRHHAHWNNICEHLFLLFSFLVFYCFTLHISLFINSSEQFSFAFFEKNEMCIDYIYLNIIRSDQNSDAASCIFTGWFSSVGLEIPRKSKNQAKQRVQCFLGEKFE